MISLSAVEGKVHSVWPDHSHAAVAVPDPKRGEQLVLFTTDGMLDRQRLSEGLKQAGTTELMIPRNIVAVEELPVLGSGKTDYVTLNKLAREQVKP
jgi:acyl-[acyl-carrier-protein]-phospholipid O-acyltransferase/long-chain-fatty-acid--[acyl-carrier-protein] ligase